MPHSTPMPVGAEQLVPGEDEEVGAELLHVDLHVRDRLRAVDQHARADAVRHLDDLLGRRDGAERVRDLRERDELRLAVEQLAVLVEQHLAAVVHRGHAQLRALGERKLLPRHDVGVVLEVRDDDLVALADVLQAPALRHQVDRLGRAADEDDLLGRRRVDEARDLLARALVGVGRARREFVRGAVDVGVLVRVEVRQPVDHRLRLLRGRRVVEPDQRPAVDLLLTGSGSRGGWR